MYLSNKLSLILTVLLLAQSCVFAADKPFNYQSQSDAYWKAHLAPDVYDICRQHGTEMAGSGKYDEFFEKGTYYCACCGGDFALYSSDTKFESHTGWPSFYAPLPDAVVTRPDPNDGALGLLGMQRIEVLCERCASHLGHVFDDGPPPTGKRYCMNSLALTFVAAEDQSKRDDPAVFAMGCFWSAESAFRDHATHEPLPGIISLKVGYAGGTMANPTYENHPGYKEALKIEYDPAKISYKQLLDVYWHNLDLFDTTGQFCDQGSSYIPVIYYENHEQRAAAESSKAEIEAKFKQSTAPAIVQFSTFYAAEDEHQDYADKNPTLYEAYRFGCGRDAKLHEIWEHQN